jgi:TPR repeat protein
VHDRVRLFSVLACAAAVWAGQASSLELNDVRSLNGGFELTPAQIEALSARALQGDGKAAVRLSGYYRFAAPDREKAIHWMMIGAEDGSATAQYNYATDLLSSGSLEDSDRSLFWLKKARAGGNRRAAEMLQTEVPPRR